VCAIALVHMRRSLRGDLLERKVERGEELLAAGDDEGLAGENTGGQYL
jgi:hypothetical protein